MFVCVCVSQYYEMSYGLNVEMHKQVRPSIPFNFSWFRQLNYFITDNNNLYAIKNRCLIRLLYQSVKGCNRKCNSIARCEYH